MWTAVSVTRYNRSARYDSPNMNGLTVAIQYAPGNDQSPSAGSTSGNLLNVPNARTVTDVGLKYANGPLNLAFSNVSQTAQTYATGWYGLTAATAGQTSTYGYVATKTNTLGANYNLGSTTVYFGWANGDSLASTTSQTKAQGSRMAVKQNFGSIDLTLQYTMLKTTTSANAQQTYKVGGLRLDNNLSKTSKVYLGYEYADSGTAVVSTSTSSGTRTTTSIGIQKSF